MAEETTTLEEPIVDNLTQNLQNVMWGDGTPLPKQDTPPTDVVPPVIDTPPSNNEEIVEPKDYLKKVNIYADENKKQCSVCKEIKDIKKPFYPDTKETLQAWTLRNLNVKSINDLPEDTYAKNYFSLVKLFRNGKEIELIEGLSIEDNIKNAISLKNMVNIYYILSRIINFISKDIKRL